MKRAALAVLVAVIAGCGTARAQTLLTGVGSGARLISSTGVVVGFSGTVAILFHGDRGSGCAAKGLCGYSGVITWRPGIAGNSGVLEIDKLRVHGHTVELGTFSLFSDPIGPPSLRSAVRREAAGGTVGTCADVPSPGGFSSTGVPIHRGTISVAVPGKTSSILPTRCAGPLDADVAGAMPVRSIGVPAAAHGHRLVDLSGTHDFARGGFAGTVRSTLVMHLRSAQTSSAGVGSSGSPGGRERVVSMPLTATVSAATLSASIRGVGTPGVCLTLDSCAARGTAKLALRRSVGRGTITAFGPARRPYRDFLAALGLSRRGRVAGIQAFGDIQLSNDGRLDWTLTQPAFCSDSAQVSPGDISLAADSGRLLAFDDASGFSHLRCPGPLLGEPLGIGASDTVPLGDLSHRAFTMRLRGTGGFSDDGYTGDVGGGLSLAVRPGRVTQHIITERVVSSGTSLVSVSAALDRVRASSILPR